MSTVPAYVGLMRFSAKRLRPMYDNLEEAYGRYSSGQIDAIRGIETVKALAAEGALRGLMLNRFQALADRVFRTEFLVLAYQGSLQLVGFATFGLFLVAGSVEVVHGNLSLGEFVAFNALVAKFKGEASADVTVAEPLSDKNLDALKSALTTISGKDVTLNVKVDPSIIGGLVVKLGSRMVDSSLRTKLNSIKHAMKEAG